MSSNKQCNKCEFYIPYYSKGFFNFYTERQGECKKRNKAVCENDDCEFWKQSNYKPNIDLKMIDKVIADTEEIKHIYEEEN